VLQSFSTYVIVREIQPHDFEARAVRIELPEVGELVLAHTSPLYNGKICPMTFLMKISFACAFIE
jgi:hypothetical protein